MKKIGILLLSLPVALLAGNYRAQKTIDHGVEIVRLTDTSSGVEVAIAPSLGNMAYEMKVHGKNILYFPATDIGEFQKKPSLSGVPFLAPWANRLNEQDFWANGKKYTFNMGLGNVRGALPIHGLLSASNLWEVSEVAADKKSAHVTSRLRFWKSPDLMAQWPFAHEYEMTYRLAGGMLEVQVTVNNLSTDAMPIVLGFHPYYRIPDVPRDEWTARLPARKIVVADERLIPTGEMKPYDLPNPLPLQGHTLDTGFADLERDAEGRAHFSIEARGMKVETMFGPKYPAAVVWEPAAPAGQTRDFICFEPMTGITNAVNLQHEGKYSGLQMLEPGAKWTESFWVRASGI
jgi:aldose 1-epimerase